MPEEVQRDYIRMDPERARRIQKIIKDYSSPSPALAVGLGDEGINRYNILDKLDGQPGIGDDSFKGNLRGRFNK